MDAAAFASRRAGGGPLDRTQRSFLLEDLALAEAADLFGHPAAEIAALPTEAAAAAASATIDKTADPAPGQGLMAQIGRTWIARLGCPHCGGDDTRPRGQASGKPRCRCISCGKSFDPLAGTPLAGLRHRDRWTTQAQALISGEPVAKAANRRKVAYTAAFHWRPRFLAVLNLDQPPHSCGIVEADETFILESFKGKRSDLPRPARKRGGKAAKRGLSVEQIPIVVARDRSGAAIDAVLPRFDAASITKALGSAIAPPAALCCDGGPAATAIARRAKLTFHVMPAPGIPKAEAPELHANNVNAYPWPFRGMDAALPRGGHEASAEPPELAANDRGARGRANFGRLDQGGGWSGALPPISAMIAIAIDTATVNTDAVTAQRFAFSHRPGSDHGVIAHRR